MDDFSDDEVATRKTKAEEPPQQKLPQKKPRIKKSKEYIEYARSRKQYLNHLTLTQSSILFMLETSNIKTGVQNRGTQHQPSRFGLATQTEPLNYKTGSGQIPDSESHGKQFQSTVHFLKAASNAICALLENAEFSAPAPANQALSKISKFATKGIPLAVGLTASRTVALVEEEDGARKTLYVWNARSSSVSYQLVSPSNPSCFCLHEDGRFVIAGTDSGSVVIWDLLRKKKNANFKDDSILQPSFTTNDQPHKNHRDCIQGIAVFGRPGTYVVCTLDGSAIASFWSIQHDSDGITLSKSQDLHLSASYYPTFSLTAPPNSVDTFLVGCGSSIWNCSRFGAATSPATYNASSTVRSISFSPVIPTLFAAGQDNGKLALYDALSQDPLLEFTLDLSTSNLYVCWSPTRASVLFVAAVATMRVFVFDLYVSLRKPIYTHKVGNAARSIAAAETANGVVLAVGEGDNSVSVLRVKAELSQPLSESETDDFLMRLYGA